MKPALAIILARGGSKGLPRKNALMVAGKPCLAWTIEAALGAKTVGTVVVSTDDPELKEIAKGVNGGGRVRVVARQRELASDTATVDAAARQSVEVLEALGGLLGVATSGGGTGGSRGGGGGAAAPIVILYGNVPVRPAGLIDRAVEMLAKTGADSVQSYAPVGKNHPWWTARVDAESGAVRPWEGDVLNHGVFRRQDLPPAFIPDGGVIAVTRAALFCELGVPPGPHAFFGRETHRRGVINPEGSVVDIDNQIDLLVADAMLRGEDSPQRAQRSQRETM